MPPSRVRRTPPAPDHADRAGASTPTASSAAVAVRSPAPSCWPSSALITVSLVNQAWPAFKQAAWTSSPRRLGAQRPDGAGPLTAQFGALAFVYGTVVASAIALVLAVPVSIGIALFTTEVVPRRLRGLVTAAIDLLAAVPSVVYGLWGVLVLAPNIQPFYDWVRPGRGPGPGAQQPLRPAAAAAAAS